MKQTTYKTVKFDKIAGIVIVSIVPLALIMLTIMEYIH